MEAMNPNRISIWVGAARPKTLWASVAPVMMGSAMAFKSDGMHLASALCALAGAVLIQIGTNFANDYFDFQTGVDTPDRLGPTRMVQAGWVRPETMRTATLLVFALALLPGAYLIWRAGWPLAVIGCLSILCGILYTAGPYPIGYVGLGEVFVVIFFGPVAVGGTYYAQTLELSVAALIAGLAPGLFSVAILTVNNLRDVHSDHRAGKRTLAVRFGVTFSKIEYLCCVAAACLIPVCLFVDGQRYVQGLMALLVLGAAIPSIRTVFVTEGAILNRVLENTGKLLLLNTLIFSIGWVV